MAPKDFISNYLSFSKKERRAHYLLAALVVLVFIAPALLPFIVKKPPQPAPDDMKQMAASLVFEPADSSRKYRRSYNKYQEKKPFRRYWEEPDDEGEESAEQTPERLFYFDPNTLDEQGWQQLGLRKKTATTIQNYLAKGGRFRQPDDLDRIYGLSSRLAAILKPYVRIENTGTTPFFAKQTADTAKFTYGGSQKSTTLILDINTADTTAFKKLPGIGSGWARRIINFRNALGGFYSVDQLAETRGLPDSVFRKIQPQLVCNPAAIQKININTADTALLRHHPYISYNLANNIVQYRRQHGQFTALADLRRLALMKEDILSKLAPYLVLE